MTGLHMMDIHQYLTFRLSGERYAVNVANIKEVLGVPKLTKIPRMPDFMRGIINLRGRVVPVLDLSRKFGLGDTVLSKDTGIIVTEIDIPGQEGPIEELVVGVFSDEVQKVVTIDPLEIEPVPKIGITIDTEFILGMGRVEGEFITILNITHVLSGKDLREISDVPQPLQATEEAMPDGRSES